MNKAKFFSIVIVSFCVISLLISFTPIKADDSSHGLNLRRRKHCWNYSNAYFGSSGTLQLVFTPAGYGHKSCSGVVAITDPISLQIPAYGNAMFVKGKIYLTLSLASIRDYVIGIDMIKAELDPISLDGTFESIGVYADGAVPGVSGDFDAVVEISEGTLEHTTCQ